MKLSCLFLSLVVIISIVQGGKLRTCYNCVYNENLEGANAACITNPNQYEGGPKIELCTVTKSCYLIRQVTVALGTIYTLSRGCDYTSKKPGCTKDPTGAYQTCIEVCDDDNLCNAKDFTPPPLAPKKGGSDAIPLWKTFKPEEHIDCYLCQYSYNPGADDSCVTNPQSLRTIKCPPTRTCYTQSQFDKGTKVIRSFSRGCEDMTHRENECRDEIYFKDCLSTCCTDKCNVGDGAPKSSHKCSRQKKSVSTSVRSNGGGYEKKERKNIDRILKNWSRRRGANAGVRHGLGWGGFLAAVVISCYFVQG